MPRDRFLGCLAGLSAGDSIGYVTEFLRLPEIRRRFGPLGIVDLPDPALVSDDSQMTWALAEALLDANGSDDPEVVMPHIARRFAEWSTSPENTRAPGATCMAACASLRSGTSWKSSGVRNSKGCGAAMRVAGVGLVYSDRAALRRIARGSAAVTHGHEAALAAAHAAALAVRLLLEDCLPDDLLQEITVATAGDSVEWAGMLERIPLALAVTRSGVAGPEDVQQCGGERWRLGEGWTADEAVASALYSFLLAAEREQGFRHVVRYSANTAGDSDSLAAIAGSLAGAAWGMAGDRGVPAEWAARLEHSAYVTDLARRLYGLSAR